MSSLAPVSYQWRKNGQNINGATSSNYVIAVVQTNDQATYSVRVSNAGGNVTSSNATLTVLIPPTITNQPISQAVAVGQNVSFSAAATGTMPITYQWLFNGTPINGATNSLYTVSNAQLTNSGDYAVRVVNIAGTTTSSNAVLAVVNPIITADNKSSASTIGTTLSWSHSVSNGNNRFLLVGVAIRNENTAVLSATYGNQELTFLGESGDGGGKIKVALYGLAMPAVGVSNVVVVIDSNVGISAGAVSFDGVSQYSPTGAFASAGGSGSSGSVNLASTNNEVVVNLMGTTGDALTLTPGGNQMLQWNISSGIGIADSLGAASTVVGNPTTTMTWTIGGASKPWALAAVALKPALSTPGITWNGGGLDNKWSTGANWVEGGAPLNNGTNTLIMAGSTRLISNVDSNWNLQGLKFDSSAGAFTISGNPLSFGTNGITNFSASAETINNDITLRVPAGISSVAGPLNLGGSFNASNYAWKVSGSGDVAFGGSISGSGLITRDGTGTLILAGANSFSGNLAINSGFVTAMNNAAFGTTAGDVTVLNGAAVRLQGNIAIGAELLNLSGNGGASDGALRNLSGDNSWGGPIKLAAAATVGADAGTLTLNAFNNNNKPVSFTGAGNTIANGVISGNGTITKVGSGTLTLAAINSFGSLLVINAGTLQLGTNDAIPNSVDVTLGGGTFATADYSQTLGTLALTANSIIDFGGGNSVIEFSSSSGVSWSAGATLFVTNWNGSHSGGGADQLYFGGNNGGLTAGQLAQIKFLGANGPHPARMLSSGEVVPVSADLVTTLVGPTSVVGTSNLTYIITVTNLGPSSAANVMISDTLPTNGTFVSASAGASNLAGVVNWNIASFPVGATTNFTVTVTAPLTGTLTNIVFNWTPTFDPNPTNNNGSATNARVVTTVTMGVSLAGSRCAKVAANTTMTWSQTVSNGYSRMLLVGISLRQRNSVITNVTYGGVALTNIVSSHGKNAVEIWGLVAPPVGTANVVVNWSGSSDMVGWSGVFTNVDQSSSVRTTAVDNASSTTPTVTVNAGAGDVVVDTVSATGDALSALAYDGQTEICNDALGSNTSNGRGASSYRAAAAGSTAMSWTLGQSKNWDIAAVVLRASTKLPVEITAQPQSLTVAAGDSATLSVTATSPSPLRYQWQFNGTPIPNATNATLLLNPVLATNAGNYRVMISSDLASITSDTAVLTVTNSPIILSLSIGGSGGTTSNGFAFELSVPVGRTYTILASTNLEDWTPISTNVATISNALLLDRASTNYNQRFYRAVVSGP